MKVLVLFVILTAFSAAYACDNIRKPQTKFADKETVITEYMQGMKQTLKKRIDRNIAAMVDSILAEARAGFSEKKCGSLAPGRMSLTIENDLGNYHDRADSILRRTLRWADSVTRIFSAPELRLQNDTYLR
jgi:hypothetical protein